MQQFKFYTYTHNRASNGTIFYVGKGRGDRANCHHNRNKHWHNIVGKHGFTVQFIAYWDNESDALQNEKDVIKELRDAGCCLCNKTDGGEGVSGLKHTESSREKMSINHTGVRHTDATKVKIGAGGKGRVVSKETREKIRASTKGRLVSEETRARIGAAGRGRVQSKETRTKISAAHMGKVFSAEHRENLRINALNRKAKCGNMP